MNKQDTTVVVGLSGGVDSAVCALLLKEQGYNVIGVFMRNWEAEQDDPHCTAEQDLSDARAVADHLQIPFKTINFAKEYWDNVFQYCLDEFNSGRTPNPDIWCNKEIKFKVFLEHAKSLGADLLATGHYARKHFDGNHWQLLKGLDHNKDQSYFLYTLGQYELAHALFPLGELEKPEVRQIAEKNGLINHNKKDSTGICFIGERNFKEFLGEFLLAKPGKIETTEGVEIGSHDGVMFYTLGQRKGLNIGGIRDYSEKAWYIVDKDLERNVIIVGQGFDHPRMYNDHLYCEQFDWVKEVMPALPLQCTAKTRYHQQEQQCTMESLSDGKLLVNFVEPQRAITPGQSVVFYLEDECLGGGIIS